MAEGAPLLREYGPKAHRGFESHRLRQSLCWYLLSRQHVNLHTIQHAFRNAIGCLGSSVTWPLECFGKTPTPIEILAKPTPPRGRPPNARDGTWRPHTVDSAENEALSQQGF